MPVLYMVTYVDSAGLVVINDSSLAEKFGTSKFIPVFSSIEDAEFFKEHVETAFNLDLAITTLTSNSNKFLI